MSLLQSYSNSRCTMKQWGCRPQKTQPDTELLESAAGVASGRLTVQVGNFRALVPGDASTISSRLSPSCACGILTCERELFGVPTPRS